MFDAIVNNKLKSADCSPSFLYGSKGKKWGYGLMLRVYPDSRFRGEKRGLGRHEPCEWTQWSLRSYGLTGSFTVYPEPRSRSGSWAWNDKASPARWMLWKKRSYGLTRVVYPDPRSRSEERDLERHEERCIEDAMEAAELRPFAQTRHLGARSGVWNDMRSTAWWTEWKKAELQPDEGRLFRSPISERESA